MKRSHLTKTHYSIRLMRAKSDFGAIRFDKFHRPDQTLKRAVESSQYLRTAASLSSVLDSEVWRASPSAAFLEHWKSSLRPIVITSLSFIIPLCIAPLFL